MRGNRKEVRGRGLKGEICVCVCVCGREGESRDNNNNNGRETTMEAVKWGSEVLKYTVIVLPAVIIPAAAVL